MFKCCVSKFGCFQVHVGLLSPVGVPYPYVLGGFQVRVGPQCPGTNKIGSLVARTQRECSNCNLLVGDGGVASPSVASTFSLRVMNPARALFRTASSLGRVENVIDDDIDFHGRVPGDDLCQGVGDEDKPLVPHGSAFVYVDLSIVAEAREGLYPFTHRKRVEPTLKVERSSSFFSFFVFFSPCTMNDFQSSI